MDAYTFYSKPNDFLEQALYGDHKLFLFQVREN